ncbi:e3 ubiquitin ligase ARI10 [Fusarium phyllophilum]|uniref:E3 ubiquitin ligase ARI10 n=1 Tax=Fusarium phyllophilum TaxID=47803 RepID=A0A8H5MQ04_9HYPO|nr:e3 ubiquitin ligase ARI10 [Fusarium phyllophilum]
MDARQDYDDDTSSEKALPVTAVRRLYEVTQRDRQYEQTPEQHLGEGPHTQDDSSHDEENLSIEMDVEDEGSEYTSDMLGDLSDGESGFQPGEDSEESDDQGVEMGRGRAHDMDLQDMLDDLSDGFSDFETGEDTEEHQPNGDSESQGDTADDEMAVDDQVVEFSEDMLNAFLISDDEQGEETEQQSLQPAAPEDPTTQASAQTEMKRHDYCHPCLMNTVKLSLSAVWYFPLKCCNEEVPPEVIEGHVSANDIQQYRENWAEHKTRDRTYCSNRQCLKFIPPKNTDDYGEPCYGDEAECPACKEVTCTACKDKGHSGACEKQVETDQALDFAKSKGWNRCSYCGYLIEKIDGLYLRPSDNDPAPQQHQLDDPPQPAPAAPNANRPRLPPMLCDHGWQRNETVALRSDDEIYLINVKSVFDPDCTADSRRVLLNKIPQGTTLTQIANAVRGVYTGARHIMNGAIVGRKC